MTSSLIIHSNFVSLFKLASLFFVITVSDYHKLEIFVGVFLCYKFGFCFKTGFQVCLSPPSSCEVIKLRERWNKKIIWISRPCLGPCEIDLLKKVIKEIIKDVVIFSQSPKSHDSIKHGTGDEWIQEISQTETSWSHQRFAGISLGS